MTIDDDATHEADVRAGLEAINAEYVAHATKQLRDAGVPDHLVEPAIAAYAKTLADNLDRDMPLILRDLKLSTGEIRLQ